MKTKKLLLIGAIALVIIGCVLAAGCTSTETTTTDDASTDAIVGIWHCDSAITSIKATNILMADGTGYFIWNNADGVSQMGQISWKKNADGTYAVKWSTGDEATWTLNSAKDTITSSSGNTQVKKSLDEAAKSILGVWKHPQKNFVTTFNADGSGTTYKGEGNEISKFSWSVTEDGKIKVSYLSGTEDNGDTLTGKVTEWTYDRDNDAIISPYSLKYARPTESVAGITLTTFSAEPIVGVWFSDSDKGKATKIVLADGTGYAFGSNANGTVKVYKITWKKNADGTYAFKWSDGKEYTWTHTSAKDAMTSSAGNTQIKKSLNETAKNILGVWYNNDKDTSRVFNPDGSGIFKHNNGTASFTWEVKDIDKFELTYTDGIYEDGTTNAKGKVTKWTYDRDNDAIISSTNSKYIHPSESIKDWITLYS